VPEQPDSPSCDQLARLERRLERERAARREAEAIAERSLRKAYARQRELALLETITKAANEAKTGREALAVAATEICALTRWPVAHVFVARRTRAGVVMEAAGIWHGADNPRYTAVCRSAEGVSFRSGEGLAGTILKTGHPAWLTDLERLSQYPRARLAHEAGLATVLAFPVLVGREVVAAMEFATPEKLEPDERLQGLMAQIGAQLGRAIERERAALRARAKNRRLQALVREAQAQRQAAETASRAKSAFLAVTSHEVRTPLNAVLGLAEGLRREPLNPQQASLAEGIVDAGAMLVRLLNAVLDLSKIEAGESTLNEAPFALDATLRTIVRVWRAKAAEMGVELELCMEGLPQPCLLLADAGKVEQSLINLVSNALKFTPRGGGVRITALAERAAGGVDVVLTVDDTGPGVPAEDRERILRPYEQTATGRAAGGAGLGLSICAGHLAQMGGRISVGEASGGGASFRLMFPAKPAPVVEALPPGVAATAVGAPLRVLAAEDNAANRRVLEVLLTPAGVELAFATNGREALEATQVSAFDLILMDANMPVMDGVEALKAIRALGVGTPVHMLTANAFAEDVDRYLAAGADGVLHKPVAVSDLYELLARVAEAHAATEPARRATA
jgi:signal transduction histidine kinase/ActR/RegA family two-component response regulator